MPYITIEQSPAYCQITFDDILNGEVDISKMRITKTASTYTRYREQLKDEFLERFDFNVMIDALEEFNQTYAELFQIDREKLYNKFYIPKKSGGLREINAPVSELSDALIVLRDIFEKQMFISYHTSAFAYVKGRCTVDALKKHQSNESKWFIKLDFSNFFGSTSEDFTMSMFSMIFPFSEIVKVERGKNALSKALSLCFLNGGLPQGTPISPSITNVIMIPIDHYLYNKLRKMDKHFIYTRYADDILISSKINFDFNHTQDFVQEALDKFYAPFSINKEKTRYGSSSGRNWNLGLMLNKDNQITIGHKKKKIFKAMCYRYINDKLNNINWSYDDVKTFDGLTSYYKMVEPDYINYIISHYNQKFNVSIEQMIKSDYNANPPC